MKTWTKSLKKALKAHYSKCAAVWADDFQRVTSAELTRIARSCAPYLTGPVLEVGWWPLGEPRVVFIGHGAGWGLKARCKPGFEAPAGHRAAGPTGPRVDA